MTEDIYEGYKKRLGNPIIVALDRMEKEKAIEIMEELGREVWGYKLDALIIENGTTNLFREIEDRVGFVNLFVDLRFSGPPKAIRQSIIKCLHPNVSFVSVNFTSGVQGIKVAAETSRTSRVLVYSLDSSLSITDVNFIFNTPFRYIQSFKAAQMVKEAGAHGLYLAASELEFLSHPDYHEVIKDIPEIVAVGIRPKNYSDKGVHKFVMTPAQAFERGATKVVIGSPITKARNRLRAVRKILKEIGR
jgi:orotidine-5'-phosphate decarboxylase